MPMHNLDNILKILTFNTSAPGDSISSFNYDSEGNLLSSSDPLGHRVDFTYEPTFDQLATVRDQKGNITSYSYDAKGNLTDLTYADGSSETFGYDSKGNLTVSANRRGQTITYTYDAKFQLISKEYPDGSSATFTYDDRGNLLTATDSDSSTSFTYDSADRLTKVTDGDGRFVAYTYDTAGRRTQMADNLGNTVNYSYDAVGRLSSLKDSNNNLIASYTYNTVGSLSRSDNGNGTYTTYSYDNAGQLLSLANYKADNTVNSSFNYTYDTLGRHTSMTTLEGVTNYGYDATGQLTSVTLPNGRLIQYQYDAAGNRTTVTDSGTPTNYITNNLNQYTSVGGATYTYDTDGNLISKTEGGNTSTYTYDAENRLTSVTTADGTWNYEYDALGNRIATVHNGQRTEYLLDPSGLGNVVGEFDSNGNLVANYVHGLGLESRNGGGSSSFYDFDAIGSVAGLTGGTGSYLNQYSYLPFGENLTTTESVANPFEYVGQWGVMDEGNGLDFMRARFYDSKDGRFTQEDPIGINGGLNLYDYTTNNPFHFIDPNGNIAFLPAILILGKIWSAVEIGLGLGAYLNDSFSGNWSLCSFTNNVLVPIVMERLPIGSLIQKFGGNIGKEIGWRIGFEKYFKDRSIFISNYVGKGIKIGRDIGEIISDRLPSPSFDCNPPEKPTPPQTPNSPGGSGSTPVVVSRDPNDVVGPQGFGTEGWLIPNQTLPYMIRFENAEDAGAAAVFVTVTQQLDSDLDWTTFQLGDFGFGSFYIDVPDGFQNYSARVDARDSIGYFVDYEASLNSTTGEVTHTLTTIDPVTGELPTDVFAGFLPPNDPETQSGEGFVNYKIQAKPNLPTGTQLTTEASIIFDTNDPINTPVHLNTVDVERPSSSVNALPATTTNPEFTVTWSGNDTGSGIASYDIYVSVDGGEFGLLTIAGTSNNPPITQADKSITVDEDANATPLNIAAPTDADGDTLTITVTSIPEPTKGAIYLDGQAIASDTSLSSDQLTRLVFVPVNNANGSARTFSYSVSDGIGEPVSQAIALEITPVNDLPIVNPNKTLTVDEDANATPLNITEPTDADGDPFTITVNTIPDPSKGTIYTDRAWLQTDLTTGFNVFELDAALGLAGYPTDSLCNYGAVDGSVVTTEITVKAGDTLSFAWNFLTNELIDQNLTQNDFAFFTVVPTVSPLTATVNQLADNTSTFVPSTRMNFEAETSFNTETVTFTSAGTFTLGFGVVDVGDFAGTSGLLVDNIKLAGQTQGIALTAGTSLTLDQLTNLFFVPVANANGAAGTFSYSVSDGNGGTASQIVTLDITPVNDNPTVNAALTSTKSEDDSPYSIDLLTGASDVDSSDILSAGTVSFTALDQQGNPVTVVGLTQNSNSLLVDPNAYNYLAVSESVTITGNYDISDGNGGTVAQTINITINGVNDNPTVNAALTSTKSEDDSPYSIDLLTGASDVDSSDILSTGTVSFSAIDQQGNPVTGVGLTQNSNSLLVEPNAYNYLAVSESVTITGNYDISDGNGGTVAQTINITINGVNDLPIAVDDTATTDENTPFIIATAQLLANDSDPDGDTLTIASVGNANHGTVAFDNNGDILFTPTDNFSGQATFDYTAGDGHNGTDTATVTVTVNPVPDLFLIGDSNNNTLTGGKGSDRIEGRAGRDFLMGGAGDDILVGGSGGDTLTGGAGSDTFVYQAVTDLGDTITDFKPSEGDKLDLSQLLASSLYSNKSDPLGTYVRIMPVSGGTAVQIDPNGDLAPSVFVNLTTLPGFTGNLDAESSII